MKLWPLLLAAVDWMLGALCVEPNAVVSLPPKGQKMSAEFDALKAAVAAEEDTIAQVVAYVGSLGPLIADAAGDKAASLELADKVKTDSAALAALLPPPPDPSPAP
jgi:hypothetical protein